MDLVDDREYPQYYTMIQHPISINMVKRRIHSTYYKSLAEFRADFKLMFDNARTFNEEGSIVYEDANELEASFEGWEFLSFKRANQIYSGFLRISCGSCAPAER